MDTEGEDQEETEEVQETELEQQESLLDQFGAGKAM